ncbi:hypothetical protein ONS95_004578 [Cadophora gregata]|uniref:uncharacterized protein n=1 Tax=Cadophora gregata TaxID=51156 RepID=UPI0026DBE2E1|nr:uncharacterized protein ONS95_004578 [Cadophora gregata]KAK0105056.1 hypothetical protein ONS96_004459 [Cadophora gregata f. sp. sojae]KAK0106073.1 hypothetical protein ONS95_004578 [Cadophora gregata]
MKTFTATAILAFAASLAHAAPAVQARQFEAQITFTGAAGASYTLSVPTDGSVFPITNNLSVSKIGSLGGATCAFDGVDGSYTILVGAQTVDVGPPRVQVSGSCRAF